MRKFSNDTATVACFRKEYRNLVKEFVECCRANYLLMKIREMVVGFRRSSTPSLPVSIEGVDVEVDLGRHLENKVDW